MATPKPQKIDKTQQVKADAAVALSVPDLRDTVVMLAEVVETLERRLTRLERRLG